MWNNSISPVCYGAPILRVYCVALVCFLMSSANSQEILCQEDQDLTDYRTYNTGGDVTWAERRDLPGVPNLYAWERLKITVTGTVNINREIYEERECNWFGLHCWYEKRVRNNFVRPENVPFLWALRTEEKLKGSDLT